MLAFVSTTPMVTIEMNLVTHSFIEFTYIQNIGILVNYTIGINSIINQNVQMVSDDKIKEIIIVYVFIYNDECNQKLDGLYRYQDIII